MERLAGAPRVAVHGHLPGGGLQSGGQVRSAIHTSQRHLLVGRASACHSTTHARVATAADTFRLFTTARSSAAAANSIRLFNTTNRADAKETETRDTSFRTPTRREGRYDRAIRVCGKFSRRHLALTFSPPTKHLAYPARNLSMSGLIPALIQADARTEGSHMTS